MEPRDRQISLAYDPSLFTEVTQLIASELREHLEQASAQEAKANPDQSAASDLLAQASLALSRARGPAGREEALERARDLTRLLISSVPRLHSPRNMGHQVNPPVPFASAFGLLGSVLNPGLAIFEMSRFASALERSLILKLGERVGWTGQDLNGLVTSGGTLANLTALLSARSWRFPEGFARGTGSERPAILASADSHYSIARAAGILGLGTEQVIQVPLDGRRRMDAARLPCAFEEARERGLTPFCVVAAAGSTAVGAFDPLPEIARFASRHDLWLHVDGAHGGPMLLSERLRGLCEGIGEADSVTWDAHKMMFVPSLCTFLLFRERADSYGTFRQEAPYIFGEDAERIALDSGLRTFECTKGALAAPVWALWSVFSEGLFAALIERVVETTRELHRQLEASRDFQVLHAPECNIVCFRYAPEAVAPVELGPLQQRLRTRLVADGNFYLSGTLIDGEYALRVVVMNPGTTGETIAALLEAIRRAARLT